MTIKLVISSNTLTIGDVIRAEEGFSGNREVIEFLARFAHEEDGAPIPKEQAIERLMDTPIGELPKLVKQLQEAIENIQSDAVPLEISGG